MSNVLETAPVKIGKHEWRAIVYAHPSYGNCSDYEWRTPAQLGLPASTWQSSKEWPRYDSDNGATAGLPKSIRSKVYSPNAAAINSLCEKAATP
jgi:hypothetical protein